MAKEDILAIFDKMEKDYQEYLEKKFTCDLCNHRKPEFHSLLLPPWIIEYAKTSDKKIKPNKTYHICSDCYCELLRGYGKRCEEKDDTMYVG